MIIRCCSNSIFNCLVVLLKISFFTLAFITPCFKIVIIVFPVCENSNIFGLKLQTVFVATRNNHYIHTNTSVRLFFKKKIPLPPKKINKLIGKPAASLPHRRITVTTYSPMYLPCSRFVCFCKHLL